MGTDKKTKQSGAKKEEIQTKTVEKRRKFLAGLTASAAAAGMTSNGKWVKPVVDSVILPVHAQTSGNAAMALQARIEEADEFSGYDGVVYNDGTTVFSIPDIANFSNFTHDYSALFQPIQGQSVSVNLDVNVDVTGSGGDFNIDGVLSQTSSANVPVDGAMRANFTAIDVDFDGGDNTNSVVTIAGTIRAQGYATRRITYILRN